MNEFKGWNKILLEWKDVNKMNRLNQELYDLLGGTLIYVLEYADKNNITLPNKEWLIEYIILLKLMIHQHEINTILNTEIIQQNLI